ncbi:sulfotransferase family 2 domain-containing protein [Alcanivorax sp.]|uniref:sulfotransferase family 2 domain-containing protein n=1 Tax=Alcanivorax sp. TaxID=1872427 RepID=UPI003BACFD5A
MNGYFSRYYEYYFPQLFGFILRIFFPKKNPFTERCYKEKVIFIHVPKNAGRSIYKSVFGEDGRHIQLKRYCLYDKGSVNSFYKFAVVRDPVDRFVSAFNGLKGSAISDGDYDKFVRRYIDPFSDVVDFLEWMMESDKNTRMVLKWVHFYPQYKWVSLYGRGVSVDKILKFEKLAEDWPLFAKENGFSPELSFVGKGRKAAEKITKEHVEFIRSIYRKDCDLFCY